MTVPDGTHGQTGVAADPGGLGHGAGIAIVTGAGGGIGSAAARLLAADGWPLLICDLDPARLAALADELRAHAPAVDVLAGDIADPGFPAALIAALGDRPIGALLHAAGISPTMGDAARILAVNYDASARLVAAARTRMAPGGCAVLIASSSAYMTKGADIDAAIDAIGDSGDASRLLAFGTHPGQVYGLSKRAVIRLAEREAAAFGARGARIMSISPGLIDTPMNRAEAAATPQIATMLAKTPLGRLGESEEIATVVRFLCSPAASFLSGSDIKVDGGVLAALRS